mmetsp:Transcript_10571/g.22540  ORF Transcript_10571/g.22540 Transcript_10571/m.22540 type:complete len:150 (-) Transcript_10571:178-627(-)
MAQAAAAWLRVAGAMAKCFVCGCAEVKYRFPCCRERYCSLPCYRVHAAGQCPARLEAEIPKRARKEEPEAPEDLISEVRLCALRGHLGVRSALQSEAFQSALCALDEAQDRRQALERLLEKDKYFAKFAEDLMEAIDYFPRGDFARRRS